MRYAIVRGGQVVNVALWDGQAEWSPSEGEVIACGAEVGIGWTWDGDQFVRPPEPDEDSV